MTYPVYYDGEIEVTPPLTENDCAVLLALTNLDQTEEARSSTKPSRQLQS